MTENTEKEPISEKTEAATDKKCPSCDGVMEFNPTKGNLLCPFCGFEKEIPKDLASGKSNDNGDSEQSHHHGKRGGLEKDFLALGDDDGATDWGTETKSIICPACGAETIYDSHQTSGCCPYCGSTQVTPANDKKTIAPTGVIIFSVDSKQAAGYFKDWIKGKLFCKSDAKELAKPDKLHGVYVPYWTFDSTACCDYTGEYGIRTKNKEGQTHTDWYHTRGYYENNFDDVLVSGTSNQNRQLLKSVEPYKDTNHPLEYKPEYLAGFAAERYSIGPKEAWEEAKDDMHRELEEAIHKEIIRHHSADDTRNIDFDPEYYDITYKYLLVPIWISSFKYGDKVYNFVVNGQTGKVGGDYPISWIKVSIAAILAILVLVGIFWLMSKGG